MDNPSNNPSTDNVISTSEVVHWNGDPVTPTLPPGETDPNVLYIAVGMAIHAWENMELALAGVFAFNGLSPNPYELTSYGSQNGMFNQRMDALKRVGEAYFVHHPNQDSEGEFACIIRDAIDLSIKRHRIAHGYISMWCETQIPNLPEASRLETTATFKYRWAAPFYSIDKLRTNPVGVNGAAIDADRKLFEALHNRVAAFTDLIRATA